MSRFKHKYTVAQLRAIFAKYDRLNKLAAERTPHGIPTPKGYNRINQPGSYRLFNYANSLARRDYEARRLRDVRKRVREASLAEIFRGMRYSKLNEIAPVVGEAERKAVARAMQLDHLKQLIKERGSRKKATAYIRNVTIRRAENELAKYKLDTPKNILRKHLMPIFKRREEELLRLISKSKGNQRWEFKRELDNLTNDYARLLSRHVKVWD